MYLTRFRLNPTRRGTARLIASPQRMHATVLSALPPDRAQSTEGRVLWRVDTPTRHEWSLYIVSPGRPSMEQLQDECGWSQEKSWQTAAYGPFMDRLAVGQRWAFRLTGNPVRSVAGSKGTRGKVVPHVTVDQQRAWLIDRADRHGFNLDAGLAEQVRITRRERDSFERGPSQERRAATITRAQFDGVLEVVDPELLRTTLTRGIGRAKAYGCGLMTLARLE